MLIRGAGQGAGEMATSSFFGKHPRDGKFMGGFGEMALICEKLVVILDHAKQHMIHM